MEVTKRERTAVARRVCPTCRAGRGEKCLDQRASHRGLRIQSVHAARTALIETPIKPLVFDFEDNAALVRWVMATAGKDPLDIVVKAVIGEQVTGYRGSLESVGASVWLFKGRYELTLAGQGWRVTERRTYP